MDYPVMTTYRAAMLVEGGIEGTEEQYIEALQYLIDSGIVWQLQGFFGRAAMNAICSGDCIDTHDVLGANPHYNS